MNHSEIKIESKPTAQQAWKINIAIWIFVVFCIAVYNLGVWVADLNNKAAQVPELQSQVKKLQLDIHSMKHDQHIEISVLKNELAGLRAIAVTRSDLSGSKSPYDPFKQ